MNTSLSSRFALYCNPRDKKKLSPGFRPGPHDVICARGKKAYDHEGNQGLRSLVESHQEAYAAAKTKYEKSQIVSHIINTVRAVSPDGGFVKLIKGEYFEVGDRAAKEKIGQTFRDTLHTLYSSSTKAKARVRIQRRVQECRQKETPRAPARQPSHSSIEQSASKKTADDVRSSVSVVSNNSTEDNDNDRMNIRPSIIDITITTQPQPQAQVSLLDTLYSGLFGSLVQGDCLAEPSAAAFDLEPLPLEISMARPVEFNDTELSFEFDDSFHEDMTNFCNAMDINF